MRLFQGRPLPRGMTFHAGSISRYAPVKIIGRDERNFFARGKEEEYEHDRGGDGEKGKVLFHGEASFEKSIHPC